MLEKHAVPATCGVRRSQRAASPHPISAHPHNHRPPPPHPHTQVCPACAPPTIHPHTASRQRRARTHIRQAALPLRLVPRDERIVHERLLGGVGGHGQLQEEARAPLQPLERGLVVAPVALKDGDEEG